ncbi:MAG: hypothetical protein PUP91_10770 [Rhizonema sp. PD37]|nr:hypothetical protein [Rhizonema sp. PD37]
MNLHLPVVSLDLNLQLEEFDVWITPSLGEIQDSKRFQEVMDNVANIFDLLVVATKNFENIDSCSAISIAKTFIDLIKDKNREEAINCLVALATVMFLVTGKSDNNSKCQFPLYLRDEAGWESIPVKKGNQISSKTIPRTLKSVNYMKLVVDLSQDSDQQQKLLQEFINFILKDESCVSQLWSIGHSYVTLKSFERQRDLLASLVIFQIRGSVSASGGHKPEILLRERFIEWGLEGGIDFNLSDVIVNPEGTILETIEIEQHEPNEILLSIVSGEEKKSSEVKKTRAYDFVVPFNTVNWKSKRIYVQSQFYAGDSGSVSHKNIDQTDTSRAYIQSIIPNAIFIEYVDGAGYFSSLNGDLKKLFSKPTTTSFFQVKSAAIRFRRELEQIGFLIPLRVEQAIAITDGYENSVRQILLDVDYLNEEINRCLKNCLERKFISLISNKLTIQTVRFPLIRRYLILDIIAQYGQAADHKGQLKGSVIIPGYGPFYGIKLTDLARIFCQISSNFRMDWSNPEVMMGDINWLCEEGLVMLC